MNAYEARWLDWLTDVEDIIGGKPILDISHARAAFDAMNSDPRVKPLTPQEYAQEITS